MQLSQQMTTTAFRHSLLFKAGFTLKKVFLHVCRPNCDSTFAQHYILDNWWFIQFVHTLLTYLVQQQINYDVAFILWLTDLWNVLTVCSYFRILKQKTSGTCGHRHDSNMTRISILLNISTIYNYSATEYIHQIIFCQSANKLFAHCCCPFCLWQTSI